MKLFHLLSLILLASPYSRAESVPACNDEGKVYKICGNQEDLYAAGLKKAKSEKKLLVVVIGAEWCPWCLSMHKMLSDSKFGAGYSKSFVFTDVGLYNGKVKLPTGVNVLTKLQEQAHNTDKIGGIPVLAMVNPKNGKTTLIETEPLEKNTATEKGHDPEKVLAALKKVAATLN